jgi:hypothetical protein
MNPLFLICKIFTTVWIILVYLYCVTWLIPHPMVIWLTYRFMDCKKCIYVCVWCVCIRVYMCMCVLYMRRVCTCVCMHDLRVSELLIWNTDQQFSGSRKPNTAFHVCPFETFYVEKIQEVFYSAFKVQMPSISYCCIRYISFIFLT